MRQQSYAIFFAALVLFAGGALAQEPSLQTCTSIHDNLARLQCYDDLAKKAAPNSATSGKPTTNPVTTFSGRGATNTRPFRASGPWEAQWNGSGPIFQIYLYSASGEMLSVLANQQGGPGSSYYPTEGTYYLQVNTIGPWTVKIVPVQ
jgi:hypothetical protein